MFLFMGFAVVQIANLPAANTTTNGVAQIETSNLLYIAFAFGISLVINVWIFFRVSGALFNPAISLALALARVISPVRAVLLCISQILGGITAAGLIRVLTPAPLVVGNRLGEGISVAQGHEILFLN
jgi:aquaporin rerated protein, other eukaryote